MKKLTAIIVALAVGVASLPTLTFADTEPEQQNPLPKDLYISEVYTESKTENYFLEFYFNADIRKEEIGKYSYFTATTGGTESGLISLKSDIDMEKGSFLVLPNNNQSLDGITNTGRYIWLCYSKSTKPSCKSDYIDLIYYGERSAERSYSRDFENDDIDSNEDGIPELLLSCITKGLPNKFGQCGDGSDDEGDGEGEPGDDEESEKDKQYCNALELSEISSTEQWIELYNKTDFTILPENMTECQLWVQSGNTKDNGLRNYNNYNISIFLEDALIGAYEYVVLDMNKAKKSSSSNNILPNSSSIKDRSIIIVDSETEYDNNAIYKSQKDGTSLSYFADGWKITYIPTPGAENIYQQFQTCEAGKHINEATGNCVKDPEPPAECAEGQFRNPETGRCKKYPEATILAECPEGQFRNPATNRCKKIAIEDDLTPCAEGYERNPETNRCRKIRATEDAEYAVEPYGASNENRTWATIGIASVGGLGLIIGFQFRHEIASGFRKLIRRKK